MGGALASCTPHFGDLVRIRPNRACPWSPSRVISELGRAKKIGLTKLQGEELLNLAVQTYGVYKRTVVGISDIVVECYRRIEALDFPEVRNSKTEFCRRLGCTLTHAGRIVREAREPQNKVLQKRRAECDLTPAVIDLTPEEIADEMTQHDFKKLEPLKQAKRSHYEKVCLIMEKTFPL